MKQVLEKIMNMYVSDIPKEIRNNIVIFGAGQYGRNLAVILKKIGYPAVCFCDNNLAKQQGKLCKMSVISYEKLKEIKNTIIIMVSPLQSKEIVEQLEEDDFPYIFPEELLVVIRHFGLCFVPSNRAGIYRELASIGHYSSPYSDLENVIDIYKKSINHPKTIWDIDLNEDYQLQLLRRMQKNFQNIPKWEDLLRGYRYKYQNNMFGASDAIILHCMIRIIEPDKIIEVGSGYSSAVMLDTNEFYMKNRIQLSFIEPYPDRLKTLLKSTDIIDLHEGELQTIPIEFFESLENGDILFVDSSHISKCGSDVNYLFFEILPHLKTGVYIHIHDIFYPFEYPEEWILSGQALNEIYVLRAFLQNNQNYSIQYFQDMIQKTHKDVFMENWPLEDMISGGSIWLRKNKQSGISKINGRTDINE